jgi:hypothetical protein
VRKNVFGRIMRPEEGGRKSAGKLKLAPPDLRLSKKCANSRGGLKSAAKVWTTRPQLSRKAPMRVKCRNSSDRAHNAPGVGRSRVRRWLTLSDDSRLDHRNLDPVDSTLRAYGGNKGVVVV